jgi:tetratricopeptide (TPR) repeat protein
LITRTEGNPFFLEESVRTLVETGVLVGGPGAYRLVQPLDSRQVPATVQAVLAARIDRLPPEEKRLLQTAAVIGTEVPLSLLQAMADLPEAALHHGLAHLQAAEFLYETRLFPESAYTFKHALTHEVAYNGLLLERRRGLHGRIVEALETLYADRQAEQVERLAHHAWRSEQWDKALIYFRQAGAKAMTRSANREAVVCFEQALDTLRHLPESHDTIVQAIELRLDLRQALHALGESARIFVVLREAERLAETLNDHQRLASISNHMSDYFLWMGAPDRAVASSQCALTHAMACGDVTSQVVIRFNLAWAYATMGDYGRAIDLNRSIAELIKDNVRSGRPSGGGFMSVLCRNVLASSLAEQGAFAEGLAHGEEGIRLAETSTHPGSLARIYCHLGLGRLYGQTGRAAPARAALATAIDLYRAMDMTFWLPQAEAALAQVAGVR